MVHVDPSPFRGPSALLAPRLTLDNVLVALSVYFYISYLVVSCFPALVGHHRSRFHYWLVVRLESFDGSFFVCAMLSGRAWVVPIWLSSLLCNCALLCDLVPHSECAAGCMTSVGKRFGLLLSLFCRVKLL